MQAEIEEIEKDSWKRFDNRIIAYKSDKVHLKLSVPITYYDVNSDEITIINLSFYRTDKNVSNDQKMSVYDEIKLMIEESNNEEVLFSIIEYLRVEDYLHEKDEIGRAHV